MHAYLALPDRLLVADLASGAVRERLPDREPECVAVSPVAPDRVFAGTFDDGLYRSTDGGDSFARVGADAIAPDAVTAVAISPHDPDEVWVGTEPSGVYRSTDGGETFARLSGLTDLPSASDWSFPPRPDTHHVRWLEPDPGDPDHWYVAIEAGALVETPDAGETWDDRVPDSRRDVHTLGTHPDASARVYAAAGDGYAESDDRGATWDYPQAGLDHRYVWGLAVDPGDRDTVLVSAASGAGAAHRRGEAYLYRRRRGEEWERIGGGPRARRAESEAADGAFPDGEGTYRAVLAAGPEAGEVWAATDRGLFRTDDAGDSWDLATPPEAIDGDGDDSHDGEARWKPPRGLAVVG
ncbi:WD40/YVTN/BNR-like repeat-containing protein [Haloparvum sedimenti]|uniref:WD40/YVTN/BNR-like repeat-containing protein n=1 Tax=Haloparvum sedimenti TaxID=1678448 RepID=UPI0009B59DED|nr:hypothetical protein [Haloparvum sedimenti]